MSSVEKNEGIQDCQRAIEVARQGESLNWELSELLDKIQREELWRAVNATSFKNFVQEHLRVADSTARQLLKVRRVCDKHSIPPEKIQECGWSKLAEVAKKLTDENKDELLSEVCQLSLAELREKYRTPSTNANSPSKKSKKIVFTEEICEALRHAARFTRSDELQTNLEYVAQQFQVLMPHTPEIEYSRN